MRISGIAGICVLLVACVGGCAHEDGSAGDGESDNDVADSADSPEIEPASLAAGQIKVLNYCQSLSLYQYNPAYHGTAGNPYVTVGYGKKLVWQTLAGTPNGWATVLSAGQEYWGWRYARVECLGGSW